MNIANFTLIELAGAVAIVLLVGWLVFGRRRRVRERYRTPDVLDEGASAAARNHALIDAPSATAAALAAPSTASPPPAGDLARIKGLGPKLAARLAELGVTTLVQIAAWDDAEQARIDSQLGPFAGRPARDCWVEQARLLAGGDTGAYEARFGRL